MITKSINKMRIYMLVSQKTQYALRAVFELARHYGKGPIKVGDIAQAQAIPPRFLEVILHQLKRTGLVDSRRGNEGGFLLTRPPAQIAVGEVIEFVQGPVGGIQENPSDENGPFHGDYVFFPIWEEVREAISNVYDNNTFGDLLEQQQAKQGYVPRYSI